MLRGRTRSARGAAGSTERSLDSKRCDWSDDGCSTDRTAGSEGADVDLSEVLEHEFDSPFARERGEDSFTFDGHTSRGCSLLEEETVS